METLNRLSVSDYKQANKTPIVIILDNIRSLNNIGSVFRTADAFRIAHIYLCGITATPPHRDIHKTALGAENTVEWTYFQSTIDCIKQLDGYEIVAIEQDDNSVMLNQFSTSFDKPIAIILGNEVEGVDNEVLKLSDSIIEIPQYGTKHSINVSVANGIVVWSLFEKYIVQKGF